MWLHKGMTDLDLQLIVSYSWYE